MVLTWAPILATEEVVFLFAALLAEVLRLAWWPSPAQLEQQKGPPPAIAVVEMTGVCPGGCRPDRDDTWAALRVSDVVALHLDRLGATVRSRPFVVDTKDLARAGLDAVVRGRVSSVDSDDDTLTIDLEVQTRTATKKVRISGVARELEAHTIAAAKFAAAQVGLEVPTGADTLLAEVGHVFAVHRFLGQAELRYQRKQYRQAAVMFDRARTFRREVFVPEAILGRVRSEGALLATGKTSSDRDALAASAAERAEVDGQRGRHAEAEEGWMSFLRYTRHRALRWSLDLPLGEKPVVVGRKQGWVVQTRRGIGERWTFDPRTGTIVDRGEPVRGLVAAASDQLITLDHGKMSRLDEDLRPRWSVKLPVQIPADAGPERIELTSGLVGVKGDDAVVWLEVSFGKVGQLALEVVPLASSAGGVVVLARPTGSAEALDVALLRPGKRTPAWRTPVEDPRDVSMTRDVVVIVTPAGLTLLRTYNGQPVRAPLPLGAGAKLLGAAGRYGCVGYEDGSVEVFDIVGGEKTASIRGPAKPVGCETTADGVALAFESGDVVFYDRDGKLLDRALVPGRVIGVQRGHPEAPGPIVVTTEGLVALGEIPIELNRMRDVDGMIALANLLELRQNLPGALAVATQVAMMSAGRVKEAEHLRARILEKREDAASQRAAKWARTRARGAADPTAPLLPFRIGG